MATETYNTGRVVGWSTYEEFLKENPSIDSSKVTPQIYTTLTTYGVTRIVTIPKDREDWHVHTEGEAELPTFYTATVRVPGATWGAVPIAGLDYNYYIDSFYQDGDGKYSEAKDEGAQLKSALEKALGNIFTCYISDSSGKRAESSLSDAGYLTFAAYPDIIEFLAEMEDTLSEYDGIRLIVRGLSLVDLDVDTLYYGPQGLLFAGNGLAQEADYSIKDLSGLVLSATGYVWLSCGGYSGGTAGCDFRYAVRPIGEVLVTSTGYIDLSWVTGSGAYAGGDYYGLTSSEMENDFTGNLPFRIWNTRYDLLNQAGIADDYLYLIYGAEEYTAYPDGYHMLSPFPVRKEDGRVDVGDYSDVNITLDGKFKKPLDFTVSSALGTKDAMLYLKDKVTNEYFGSYWGKRTPTSMGCGYDGQNYLQILSAEAEAEFNSNATFSDYGRQSFFQVSSSEFKKGDLVLLTHQTDPVRNGLYFCTASPEYDDGVISDYAILNRRGAYVPTLLPSWTQENDWWQTGSCYLDNNANNAGTVEDGVLLVQGCRVYPNEVIWTRVDNDNHWKVSYSLKTMEANTPFLICQVGSAPSEVILTGTIQDISSTYSSIIQVDRSSFDSDLARTIDYSSIGGTGTATVSAKVSPGTILRCKHTETDIYGYQKSYFYFVKSIDSSYVQLASAQFYVADPTLYTVTGIISNNDAAVPRYKQYTEETPSTWTYSMRRVLEEISAKEFFTDFGFDIDDYVDEAFQSLSLGSFLQACAIRTTLAVPPTAETLKSRTLARAYHFYSKEDLRYTPGSVFPEPTTANPIVSSVSIEASTSGTSFSTVYYQAVSSEGTILNLNDPNTPIWGSVLDTRFGKELISLSLVDSDSSLLDFTGRSGTISADKITWLDLLVALSTGQSVDLLQGLKIRTEGTATYLETPEGLRIYLSATEPTGDIPLGSIGIGW